MNKKTGSKKSYKSEVSFQDKQTGRFLKGRHWRPYSQFRDKDYLEKEYVEKQRSTGEIANEHHVSDAAILFWLRKHGIKRRSISEVRTIKHWGASGEKNGMYGRCGAKNPRWIDGSSPLRQSMYAQSFWKELSKAVYERDRYKCKRCLSSHTQHNRLHAHHVKPWAGFPESRFDLNNLVTLCNTCHQWVHSNANIHHELLSK